MVESAWMISSIHREVIFCEGLVVTTQLAIVTLSYKVTSIIKQDFFTADILSYSPRLAQFAQYQALSRKGGGRVRREIFVYLSEAQLRSLLASAERSPLEPISCLRPQSPTHQSTVRYLVEICFENCAPSGKVCLSYCCYVAILGSPSSGPARVWRTLQRPLDSALWLAVLEVPWRAL